ncbi:hypothetical protein [Fortiea contorta]|uniref:hypothetical protein n=1 Tax=Fortiea contorta TaxID=1892405 RepID=UPI0012B56B64|nr:hypothetical protein [Fortiea contorta]
MPPPQRDDNLQSGAKATGVELTDHILIRINQQQRSCVSIALALNNYARTRTCSINPDCNLLRYRTKFMWVSMRWQFAHARSQPLYQ